jgi:hypothetical protein
MSCFFSLFCSALTKVTLPVISSLRSLSRRTVLGTSKDSFSLEPIVTPESSQNTASWALMEASSVYSLNSFPRASIPETRVGRESSKLRSVFSYLEAFLMEDLSNNIEVLIVDYIYATGLRMYQSLLKMICRVIFSYFFSSGKVRLVASYA